MFMMTLNISDLEDRYYDFVAANYSMEGARDATLFTDSNYQAANKIISREIAIICNTLVFDENFRIK
jgi:hypothetical protein